MSNEFNRAILDAEASIERFFRANRDIASKLVSRVNEYIDRLSRFSSRQSFVKIMNFCGTHEWTVTHFGLRSLLPSNLEIVAGPGCPVCVTPSYYVEEAIKLSLEGVTVYTYGDTFRLNANRSVGGARSLSEAKALGGSVRLVSNILEAIHDAKEQCRQSVFLGIGFETVAPGYARAVIREMLPSNLSLMCLVKLTPPAMLYTISVSREEQGEPPLDGVIAPGHVSTIIGGKAWTPVAEKYGVPVVVSGFEPIDVLLSIVEILRQLARGEARVFIEYARAVTWQGDVKAQQLMDCVFETTDDAWRGIGFIPRSGFRLRDRFKQHDAFYQFGIKELSHKDWSSDIPPGCKCAEITLGRAKPTDCPLFLKYCTPSNPIGPCMVSIEGTCSIWAKHGGQSLAEGIAREAGLK